MLLRFEQYRIVPMIIVMGTIFFLSHQTGDSIDMPELPGIDKFAHFVIYGVLAASVIVAHGHVSRANAPLKVSLSTIGVCLLYGLSDEFHQSFVPGRYVSGGDIIADTIGACIVCSLWLFGRRRVK